MSEPIRVVVKSEYLPEQSDPEQDRYVFGYTITLANEGAEAAQLISRHWIVTDSNDKVQEVRGYGVVGEQPRLEPGESYTYTSGVILATETGTMTGSYQMRSASGSEFDAAIPTFALVPPSRLH